MASPLLQPPVPFADFEFAFDPSLSNLFPNPPPLPPSAELFSPSETTDLLGFLDNFGDLSWDLAAPEYLAQDPSPYDPPPSSHLYAPYSNPHLNTAPDPSTSNRPRAPTRSGSSRGTNGYQSPAVHAEDPTFTFDAARETSQSTGTPSEASATSSTFEAHPSPPQPTSQSHQRSSSVGPRQKSLLSTPQKRLNHIMSEQKRRNAIRDGYAQLIALLAPAGSAPGLGMPTRGRPKGSGSRGKGQSKGKSGVLFRAVEYCKWLEEDRDALLLEVSRVEAAAGIQPA